MASPIQQLVDAANQVLQICEDGDTGCDFERVVAAMWTTREALDAVESAQVETRWDISELRGEEWVAMALRDSLEDARRYVDGLGKDYRKVWPQRIVRIDTYRSVESDQ